MPHKKIALFDLDGTLANYEAALRRDQIPLMSPGEEFPPSLHEEMPPHWEARVNLIRCKPKWWQKLEILPEGIALLQLARDIGFQINILTKGPSSYATANSWTEKRKWCHCKIAPLAPGYRVTITEDKGDVYGRVLVDDYPKYMDAWLEHRPKGMGIMPAQAWNVGYSHPRVVRYEGSSQLDVARAIFQQAYDR